MTHRVTRLGYYRKNLGEVDFRAGLPVIVPKRLSNLVAAGEQRIVKASQCFPPLLCRGARDLFASRLLQIENPVDVV